MLRLDESERTIISLLGDSTRVQTDHMLEVRSAAVPKVQTQPYNGGCLSGGQVRCRRDYTRGSPGFSRCNSSSGPSGSITADWRLDVEFG